jgi:hypothetical protein
MKRLLLTTFLLLAPGVVVAGDTEHSPNRTPDTDNVLQKDFVDEARSFLKSARTIFEKLPEQIGRTVYQAGVRDGALGAAVVLIIVYLAFLQPKKP